MDYKKLYEEALKRAKAAHNSAKSDKENGNKDKITEYTIQLTETIFPELKESEDEKIRKALIDFVEQYGHKYYGAIARASAISWLEKQGAQKPTDKVEPKFKVGDWAVNQHGYTRQIIDIKNDCYYCIRTESFDSIENPWYGTINYVDKQWHKWTIQDAKDGDVLCGYPTDDYPWIGIFHELNDDYTFSSYCYLQAGITGKFCPPSGVNIFNRRNVDEHSLKSIVPATKEQRDILFQKMKEAGYEWDAEKKELRKIEKNHVWSEEDETFTRDAVAAAEEYYTKGCGQEKLVVWLKSLKDRVKGEWI